MLRSEGGWFLLVSCVAPHKFCATPRVVEVSEGCLFLRDGISRNKGFQSTAILHKICEIVGEARVGQNAKHMLLLPNASCSIARPEPEQGLCRQAKGSQHPFVVAFYDYFIASETTVSHCQTFSQRALRALFCFAGGM